MVRPVPENEAVELVSDDCSLAILQRWIIQAERLLAEADGVGDIEVVNLQRALSSEVGKKREILAAVWTEIATNRRLEVIKLPTFPFVTDSQTPSREK